jgi:hypothetical protein
MTFSGTAHARTVFASIAKEKGIARFAMGEASLGGSSDS